MRLWPRRRTLRIPTTLEWSCHFCGRIRDDRDISVVSRTKMIGTGALIEMRENRRYCNDSIRCIEKAQTWRLG